MVKENKEILPTRLNVEPPVFRGCSMTELQTIAGLSALTIIPTCVILLSFVGYAMMGVGLGFLASIGGIVIGATQLQKMKRGRPIGYYQLQIGIALDKYGIKKNGLIRRSGYWRVGRTNGRIR